MQAAANAVQNQMGLVDIPVEPSYKAREDGSKMKALAWFGSNDVRMVQVPVPAITQPDDVIVKVTGTTICGSDLHLFHGEIVALQKGDILGHEFMGVVDRVGPNVTNLKPGQRVVASFQVACGKCTYCKQKLSSMCDNTNNSSLQNAMYGTRDAGFFGYSHFTGGFPGGQAEYVKVPYGNVNLLPIPDNVTDEQAVYLSDVIPTSYHCVVDTGVKEGDVVAVWGLGPIGQCVARWAQIKGAKRIIGIDAQPQRLAFAAEKLGIETLNFKEHSDVPKRLHGSFPEARDMICIACGNPHLDIGMLVLNPSTNYDRYFDQRASLPLGPLPPRRFDSIATCGKQPPRLPSILTPSGRMLACRGRIQDISPVPAAPLIMFWPDNEPLPQASQIRPPFSPGSHPPTLNTGNREPVEHQPGDWFCGKYSYMSCRRRKVCQTCYPFAEGNAESVPASAQAERINVLAQMVGIHVLNSPEPAGLGLNLTLLSPPARNYSFPPKHNINRPDSLASSFGSMSLASASHSPSPLDPLRGSMLDRRASVDQAIGTGRAKTNHVLRARQSDAALRLSGVPFSVRPKPTDGVGLGGVREGAGEGLAGLGARRTPEEPDAGLTYGLGLGRRSSAANIWATDNAPKSYWPTDLRV
ncbi:hypothetical protein RSOLAG22IIIB_10840 [Rhizoctonia solani]|uniref:Alcohol dehydrogenase-like N-terminal domain-containing protein n=1 Tax=Rhizoctonia solani TaxID=456999 RepID=A0A0K6G5I2_9AGAM|nr:hypothetical protein RSOLAG22IIIB_10840 [Rhizoctonia solani]